MRLTLFALILFLSACSNAPSQTEIEHAIQERNNIIGCKYILLKTTEKENIIPGADSNRTSIQIKVNIAFEGANALAEKIEIDRGLEYAAKEIFLDKELKGELDGRGYSEAQLSVYKLLKGYKLAAEGMVILGAATKRLEELYGQGCVKVPSKLIHQIFLGKVIDYKKPISITRSERVKMVKTEKGWLLEDE